MKTYHKIIQGDSRKMQNVPNESIHLIITSPPYWQLKDYGNKEQIGFHESYESYINSLNLVWQECYRSLHPGCRLCICILPAAQSLSVASPTLVMVFKTRL